MKTITALQGARDVEMVFYLRRGRAAARSASPRAAAAPGVAGAPLKRIMTPDVISVRVDTDQEEVARQVASCNWPSPSWTKRTSWRAW
ncbi:MAG: hypothetical protein R2712_04800 [Vicinamibacterales bacterium]